MDAALQPGFGALALCYHPALCPFMKLIDVSVPLDATLPTYPHNTPFSLEPIKRLASGDS